MPIQILRLPTQLNDKLLTLTTHSTRMSIVFGWTPLICKKKWVFIGKPIIKNAQWDSKIKIFN